MVKVTEYRSEHKELILELMESMLFKEKIWDWQFTENPWANEFRPVLVTDDWDTAIGFNGVPPITMTRLSFALMKLPSSRPESSRLLVLACRNFMAK